MTKHTPALQAQHISADHSVDTHSSIQGKTCHTATQTAQQGAPQAQRTQTSADTHRRTDTHSDTQRTHPSAAPATQTGTKNPARHPAKRKTGAGITQHLQTKKNP